MFALEFSPPGGRVAGMVSSSKWPLFFKAIPIHFVILENVKRGLFLSRQLFDISILNLSSLYSEEGHSNLLVNLVISVYKIGSG